MAVNLPTRPLGCNGPQVVALGAGLMSLGGAYGAGSSDEERFAYLDRAYELGETNRDSTNIYGDTEDLVGKWFKRTGKRNAIFLATKFGFMNPMDPTNVRSDPENVFESCERSLKRLQTEWINLFYCHRVDGKTPIERTVQAMADLKKQGKIHYLGLSEVSSMTRRRAHAVHPILAVQIEYSPLSLDIEDPRIDILNTCKELGSLSSPTVPSAVVSSPENFPKSMAIVNKIKAVAEKKGVTTGQVTLAWLMSQWEDVIPIPGKQRISALEENVEAMKINLVEDEIREIRKACENAGDLGGRYPEAMMHRLFADTPEL